jgi:hypothetical protein
MDILAGTFTTGANQAGIYQGRCFRDAIKCRRYFSNNEDVFAMFSRVELQLEKKTKGASDHNLSSQQLKENENFCLEPIRLNT